MMSPVLGKLEHDYGDKLRVIFREFPLAMHKHALLAARTAEAAGLQGKFWEMHDTLYKNRVIWAAAPDVPQLFSDYARSIGLDVDRLKRDLESQEVSARILADQQRGTSIGVKATPSLFINNQMIPFGSFNEQALRSAIDQALSGKTPTFAPTPTPTPLPVSSPKP
jgi:protein-disulfide isomerase